MSEIKSPPKDKEFIRGEILYFLGKEYQLILIAEANIKSLKIELVEEKLIIRFPAELEDNKEKRKTEIRGKLISWYRSQAKTKINTPDILVNNACYSTNNNYQNIEAEEVDKHYKINTD